MYKFTYVSHMYLCEFSVTYVNICTVRYKYRYRYVDRSRSLSLLRGYKLSMASPRFVHDAVVVTTPGVTPCHPTAGPAQKPTSHALPPARSPTAPAGFQGLPIGQIVQQEDRIQEADCCPGVSGACQHGPGQAEPISKHSVGSVRQLPRTPS